ncbi:hypothetical protein [Ascidiaceihabitans sp.]|uniref:hypothetical protein n=1 Tax=Ascidiaceihabitans sp. TaxID=1872644 RepID=UPI00329A10E7
MSDETATYTTATSTSGGNSGLAFVVGALVVVVAVLAWFMFPGADGRRGGVNISIEGAADDVSGK